MNIANQLKAEISRKNTEYIAHYVGNDPELFKQLIDMLFNGASPLPHRASWVVTTISDQYPELLKPYLKRIVAHIESFDHSGTRRNLLRYIAETDLPDSLKGKLYDVCYRWLQSRLEPPAVKVHCMQILFNISEKEPDLRKELRLILEELTDHESAAIKSRCRKLMKKFS
jgi:hypothetical protein